MSIQVTGISKFYGKQKALDNLSFTVNSGEIVGFLGPNGAGKSTTMKIITGYLVADEGEVLVSSINVNKEPIETKKKIGYLPEANPLYYDMYVREYLDFIAGLHKIDSNKKKIIEEKIDLTGLQTESNKKIGQLSKGYKQRVGLAAALIHDPEVLILDEPTSGLDPNQIIEIREVIKTLGKNKTVLFSTHILQEVEAICDRVIIINKGRIVADDTLMNLQGGNKKLHSLVVSFNAPVERYLLNGIEGITTIDELKPLTFRLNTSIPEKVRKQLMEFCLQHNLNIVSLHSEEKSLEDIFKNLTT